MATTTAQTTDVATALHDMIKTVPNLRVYPYTADIARPPAVVITQPTLTFNDQSSGFCKAIWLFPLVVVTTRANDRAAQAEMSKLLLDIVTALDEDTPAGLLSVEPLSARPLPGVTVNGQELPAYQLDVRIRA